MAAARIADGTDVDFASCPPAPLDTEGSIRFRGRRRRNRSNGLRSDDSITHR